MFFVLWMITGFFVPFHSGGCPHREMKMKLTYSK
jgi:hypothetical protein